MKQKITVSLDENLVRIIDQRKGDVSRSKIFSRALSQAMGIKESEKVLGVVEG